MNPTATLSLFLLPFLAHARTSPEGVKERVDFGETIGDYAQDGVSTPTTNGIITYAKDGIHIIPARPN